jgi:peroxiredoxin Q/BCP
MPDTTYLKNTPKAGFAVGVFLALGAIATITAVTLTGSNRPAIAAVEEEKKTMIGKPAPDFTLPDQNDKPVKLSAQKGKWVVLAFYPADMTSGCTLQNRSYTEYADEFAPKNAVVYTISTQDTKSKREFCTRDGLKHSLLSDVGGAVAKQYETLGEGKTYASRWTYYIAPDGTVAYVDKTIKVGTAAQDSLAQLEKLSKGTK